MALQVTGTLAVNCCVPEGATVTAAGETETVTGAAAMVTVAVAVLVGEVLLVAVIVTMVGLGIAAGAVNRPVEEMAPAVALQVTGTLAVNC